jgi:hypothetical protein
MTTTRNRLGWRRLPQRRRGDEAPSTDEKVVSWFLMPRRFREMLMGFLTFTERAVLVGEVPAELASLAEPTSGGAGYVNSPTRYPNTATRLSSRPGQAPGRCQGREAWKR